MALRKILCWTLAVGLAGCANAPPVEHASGNFAYQAHPGSVAVIVRDAAPEVRFEGFVRSKGEGATKIAGDALGECLAAAVTNPYVIVPFVAVLMGGICGAAGAVGGLAGAANAPSEEQALASEAAMSRAIDVHAAQEELRKSITDAARASGIQIIDPQEEPGREAAVRGDYRPLAQAGIQTVLEATLSQVGTRAGLTGSGLNDPAMSYVQVNVRLLATTDNGELVTSQFRYAGRRLKLDAWSADGGKPLREELLKGCRLLGAHISDSVFLLYPFPHRGPTSIASARIVTEFGLAPIHPRPRMVTDDASKPPSRMARAFSFGSVTERRPRFQWQAFPRPEDLEAAPGEMARVKEVTYDFVLALAEDGAPGKIVYRAQGLTTNELQIPFDLQSGRQYYWTVRPHFLLDGRQRVSEWGMTRRFLQDASPAPSQLSYLFYVE